MNECLHATFIALFGDELLPFLNASILGRAQEQKKLRVQTEHLRTHALDKHKSVDDTPSGGGAGLVLKVDVVVRAIESVLEQNAAISREQTRVILIDPVAKTFTQQDAKRLAAHEHLVFVCGRYEGFDARVRTHCDEALSLGDFVLTGGELAAACMLDAVAREREGVLGNAQSSENESHQAGVLEHRQYTRPNVFRGESIPKILRSGDHKKVERVRARDALLLTQHYRPDLFNKLSDQERALLAEPIGDLAPELDENERGEKEDER